jgi:hypothetical protein
MRFYNQPHAYYCGALLHARSMFTHVLDHGGIRRERRERSRRPGRCPSGIELATLLGRPVARRGFWSATVQNPLLKERGEWRSRPRVGTRAARPAPPRPFWSNADDRC